MARTVRNKQTNKTVKTDYYHKRNRIQNKNYPEDFMKYCSNGYRRSYKETNHSQFIFRYGESHKCRPNCSYLTKNNIYDEKYITFKGSGSQPPKYLIEQKRYERYMRRIQC